MQDVVKIIAELPKYVIAVQGVLVSLIALFMIIPGEQPEKALKAVVDFIAKFSKK